MFLRNFTRPPQNSESEIEKLRQAIDEADAVLIGAGAGLSTAAGFTYSGESMDKYFPDFKEKYGITDTCCHCTGALPALR